jgi:hypothetical protein
MALHDWSKVPIGLFHHFHQDWSIELARTLNRGLLPSGLSALVEQRAGPKQPDVLAIEGYDNRSHFTRPNGLAILDRPVTRHIRRSSREIYATRANRIVVRHTLGRIMAVIEIVSPGNKDSQAALRDFGDKAVICLYHLSQHFILNQPEVSSFEISCQKEQLNGRFMRALCLASAWFAWVFAAWVFAALTIRIRGPRPGCWTRPGRCGTSRFLFRDGSKQPPDP